jgi:hypothetical protein
MAASSLGATHWTGYLAENKLNRLAKREWELTKGKSIGRLASDGSWESGLSGASSDLKVRKEETHLKKCPLKIIDKLLVEKIY